MSSFHSLKIVDVLTLLPSLKMAVRYEYQLKGARHELTATIKFGEIGAHAGSTFRYPDPNFELRTCRLQCLFNCGRDGDTTDKNHSLTMRFPSAHGGGLIRYALNKSTILRLRFPVSHKIVVLLQNSRYEFVPGSIIEVTSEFDPDGRCGSSHTAGVSIHTICNHEALGQYGVYGASCPPLELPHLHPSISESQYLPELFRRERIGHVTPLRPLARQ